METSAGFVEGMAPGKRGKKCRGRAEKSAGGVQSREPPSENEITVALPRTAPVLCAAVRWCDPLRYTRAILHAGPARSPVLRWHSSPLRPRSPLVQSWESPPVQQRIFLRYAGALLCSPPQPHTPLSLSAAILGHINSSFYSSFHIYICGPMGNSRASINIQLLGSNPTTMKCNYRLKVCNEK